jgi:hypothetical protein
MGASVTALISLTVGVLVQWQLNGITADIRSLAGTATCSVATAATLFIVKFGWQLFLAPSEIVQSEMQPILEGAGTFGVSRPPNFAIWKHRQTYNAAELAGLLVGLDPGSASNGDSRGMQALILEHVRSGDLKYSPPTGMGQLPQGYIPDVSVNIAKEDAIAWADARGFGAATIPLR